MKRILSRPATAAVLLLFVLAWFPAFTRVAFGGPTPPAPTAASSSTPAAAPSASPSESPSATPSPSPSDSRVGEAVSALSRCQAMLEFYFMQVGDYPANLADLNAQFNQAVPQSASVVQVPLTDPVTGQKLKYTVSADHQKYTLGVPDASRYGVASLEIHQVDWGWMTAIANNQKRVNQAKICASNEEKIAQVLDAYSQTEEHRNQYPDTLEAMIPKYMTKLPTCPACNKPYVYTHNERGFVVACPEPKKHGLKELSFSSTDGPKAVPLDR